MTYNPVPDCILYPQLPGVGFNQKQSGIYEFVTLRTFNPKKYNWFVFPVLNEITATFESVPETSSTSVTLWIDYK